MPDAYKNSTLDATVLREEAGGSPSVAVRGAESLSSSQREGCQPRYLQASCSYIWESGTLCMVLATLVFAFSALGVKLLVRLSVFEIVFVRSSTSWLAVCVIKWVTRSGPIFGSSSNRPLLASRGLFGATAMTLFYICIQLLPLGDAMSIFFLNAAATSVAAYLFGYERASWFIVAGCATSIGGVVLIAHPPLLFGGASWSMSRVWGVSAGLVSAICAAGAFLSIRAIGEKEEAIVTTVWFHATAAMSSFFPLLLSFPAPALRPTAYEGAVLLAVAGTSFWGQLLLARGFQLTDASSAAAINLLQVVHAHILQALFLHDKLTWYSMVGAACIGAGAVLVHFRHRDPRYAEIVDAEQVSLQTVEMPGVQHGVDVGANRLDGSHGKQSDINILPG